MKISYIIFLLALAVVPATPSQADCLAKEKLHVISSAQDRELHGFADAAGHVRIKPRYSIAQDFSDYGYGYADGYWIGLDGRKLMLAFAMDGEFPDNPVKTGDRMRYQGEGGKLGFVDHCLRVVIPAQFDYVSKYRAGLALVCKGCDLNTRDEHPRLGAWADKAWGIIDKTGKLVVPMIYSYDQILRKGNEMAEAKAAKEGRTP